MNSTSEIKQEWLLNLKNLCGKKYEIDEYGNLIQTLSELNRQTMMDYT